MGLLNRTKKSPKVICPSCGKPNDVSTSDGPRRCKICRSILPATVHSLGSEITLGAAEGPPGTGGPDPDATFEHFDMEGLSMTHFDRAPQGRAGLEAETAAAAPVAPAPAETGSFDIDGLEVGEPALPAPSSNA